jgi:hypothetical protein
MAPPFDSGVLAEVARRRHRAARRVEPLIFERLAE